MLRLFLQSKILLSIWLVSLTVVISLFFFIPYITEKNIIALVVQNSKNSVEQMKDTRTYYLNTIVNDIKDNNSNIQFSPYHKNNKNVLPLPATMIHDLSEIYSQNSGIKFRIYSEYPFQNRSNRILTDMDKKILNSIENHNGLLILKDNIENQPVLRVAIADYMNDIVCVKCHNSHPDKLWEKDKWELGDMRGVIEIITPLNEAIQQNQSMRNIILIFISTLFLILIIFYSYKLIKREDELQKYNDILDTKVKNEIEKNKVKEQLLIQRSKLSSMGEMVNSIAHQWRQPLAEMSSILLHIRLRDETKQLETKFLTSKLDKGNSILQFMSKTIDGFQSFFKEDKQKVIFSLIENIEQTLTILDSNLSKSNIKVNLDVDKDIKLFGFKNEFSQVLLNIIVNSYDAFILNEIQNPYVNISAYTKEKNILIKITDNANGIDENALKKIFDLYYTTKENGSGIGLYISKIIIEKHFEGNISVKNIDNGTEFIISLPKTH